MNIEELVDDFITFYVAGTLSLSCYILLPIKYAILYTTIGQETTAYTTMFAIMLLTQHPNVLER